MRRFEIITIYLTIILSLLFTNSIVMAESIVPKVLPSAVKVEYLYDHPKWAFYDIPSTAKAYSQRGIVIGIASIKDQDKIEIGQSITEFDVIETIYDADGSGRILYKGEKKFKYHFGGKCRMINQKTLFGIKPYEIFTYWPYGS